MIGYLRNYASTLLKRVGYDAKITVKWSDDTSQHATACTNGLQIEMPREFLGVKLDRGTKKRPTKQALALAKGLILHEIGHSLQPLNDINQTEQETGLHHAFVNIALDVHLERVALVLYKKEAINLLKLRAFIRKRMMSSYKADWPGLTDFPDQAQLIALIGRYKYSKKPYAVTKKMDGAKVIGKLHNLDLVMAYTPGKASDLCAHLRNIASEFPELCDPTLDLPEFPTMKPDPFGDGMPTDEEANEQLEEARKRAGDIMETVYVKVQRNPPKREAVMLAAKLRMRLSKSPTTSRIIAPVVMNRRKLATGDDQPWFMDVKSGNSIGRSLTILFDVSFSMYKNDRLEQAMIASQALCLAVESERGNVCGGQFGAYGVLTQDMDAALLFSGVVCGAEHVKLGLQKKTSYQLLADVWLTRKEDRIIVITDGEGFAPEMIKPEDKKRTHVICLGGVIPYAATKIGQCLALGDNELDRLPEIMLKIAN